MFLLIGRRLLLVCFLVKRKCGSHRTTNNANKHENSKENRLDIVRRNPKSFVIIIKRSLSSQ